MKAATRACVDCGVVGRRTGDLCRDCAMGAPAVLKEGDWETLRGVRVWVSHVPKTAAPVCPSCGRQIHLRGDGSVWKHLSSGSRCPGSGRLPVGDYERGARAV